MSVTGKAFFTAALIGAGLPADAECRQALALGLDVSGSVDAVEYRLQLDGLAAALLAPDVSAAILSDPMAPIRLSVYQWSGPDTATILLPWTEVASASDLSAIAARLTTVSTAPGDLTTSIGSALMAGKALLDQQPDCWRHTLDLSGDGENNTGPRPQDIPEDDRMTVNGLVILGGEDDAGLLSYWKTYVIRGPEAFVEPAAGFDDYEAAMRRKLLRELRSLALGSLDQ